MQASPLRRLVARLASGDPRDRMPHTKHGHFLIRGKIISAGPYAHVRHPLYLAAFLVWFSLVFMFSNVTVLLVAVLYVVPGYLVYIRAEEEMMLLHFGDAYATYCARVGMLFPRIRK